MVVKMMRWRPWPSLLSKKYQVKLVVLRLEGSLPQPHPRLQQQEEEKVEEEEGQEEVEEKAAAEVEEADEVIMGEDAAKKKKKKRTTTTKPRMVTAEVKWKGPKGAFSSLRRSSVKRNFTKQAEVFPVPLTADGGTVVAAAAAEWNEEFHSVCCLTSHKDNHIFHPWEIAFSVFFNELNQGPTNKDSIVGKASLNLAEFAYASEEKDIEINIPLSLLGFSTEPPPSLYLTLSLLELRTTQESCEMVQRSVVPVPLSPTPEDPLPFEKDELSALKAGLRKVKILTELVSTRKTKQPCQEDEGSEGRYSVRSEDAEYTYPFDTDSLDDDLDDGELEDRKADSSIRKSFSYGALASTNGGSLYSDLRINGEYEDWVYYSHRRLDVGCSHIEETTSSDQPMLQISKRSILPWKKRKLSFRSPKAKGEPLLKKAYGEEGGDDIDFDRRQLSSSDESFGCKVDDDAVANRSSVSEFGDDNFTIGSWETKEVVSRDGRMKLCTQVFFASIDQRSERAAGESACTALVAVIANWFQTNHGSMPIKSQFDSLIREGSLEWRNLCKDETHRERFPDKHFDLETVLQAKIRPLSVAPRKSFIGFFHPEVTDDDNSGFDFLHGAMSFDSIWDEISRAALECPSGGSPHLYIVSWNDHFFVLKVEPDAYYILDTLGERLYEGCNQAYILKFDENSSICRMPSGGRKSATSDAAVEAGNNHQAQKNIKKDGDRSVPPHHANHKMGTEEVVCRGKESCKEYIKSFLAAIPIRELQADISKGLMASTPIHHRLQIEFHYTEPSKQTGGVLPQTATEAALKFPRPAVDRRPASEFTLTLTTTEIVV